MIVPAFVDPRAGRFAGCWLACGAALDGRAGRVAERADRRARGIRHARAAAWPAPPAPPLIVPLFVSVLIVAPAFDTPVPPTPPLWRRSRRFRR